MLYRRFQVCSTSLRALFSALPEHQVLTMPSLSPTMTEGKIASWNFAEGDEVGAGDVLADIETDKSTMGYEIQEDGYIAKILTPGEGITVPLGEPIAIIVPDEEDLAAFKDYVHSATETSSPAEAQPQQTEQDAPAQQQTSSTSTSTSQQSVSQQSQSGDRVLISPLAKKTLSTQGVDLSQLAGVQGSGPRGRILQKDVAGGLSVPSQPIMQSQFVNNVAPGTSFVDEPVSGMRRSIANHLTASHQGIPSYQVTMGIRMNALINLRKQINAETEVKVTVSDMIIKACALSCEDVPAVNTQYMGDFVRQFEDVDVNFAVSVENGLLTPKVTYANGKTVTEIATETKSLIEKCRSGKLMPDEYQGGTFTISNLGMMGVRQFSSIINAPQSCILSIAATEKRPVFSQDAENNIEWVDEMLVTLTSDHRTVDGAVAAEWINRFKYYMENPLAMLVQSQT